MNDFLAIIALTFSFVTGFLVAMFYYFARMWEKRTTQLAGALLFIYENDEGKRPFIESALTQVDISIVPKPENRGN